MAVLSRELGWVKNILDLAWESDYLGTVLVSWG